MTAILFVLGTRPEIIKLSPVIDACSTSGLGVCTVHTGQHYADEINGRFFRDLGMRAPDRHLDVGSLPASVQVAQMLERLDKVLEEVRPAMVVVQGDTNSTLAGALAANRRRIPLAHVEAGLRSYDRRMPEEHNRILVDHLSDLLFCPTELQATILRREGFGSGVHVVGNTVADAVRRCLGGAPTTDGVLARFGVAERRYAFLTLHRAENVDDRNTLQTILHGVAHAADEAGLTVVFPVHPRTAQLFARFGIGLAPCFRQVPPIGYRECLALQAGARVVLSDSGGLQEEAAILQVPCVTLRTSTERPETLDGGGNILAGVDAAGIARAVERSLLAGPGGPHPYGDGHTAERIVSVLREHLDSQRGSAAAASRPPAAPAAMAAAAMSLPSDGDSSGRYLGEEEVELAARAIRSGTLNSTKGTFVARLEKEFAAQYGVKHAIACASGTAAVHCAIAALKLRAGDEVITTPITDMGAITPILYEGAVPVFADVDPDTINVTADTIRAQLGARTRAIVVTHLFGLPCRMAPILQLARERGIPVIEDSAQAFFAEDSAGRVGTLGTIGCFSLQQGKHMTTGEGGIVVTNDDAIARQVFLFVNKAWGYGDPQPDHYFPALNYRLTELQGAVAIAQLRKVRWVVERRRAVAARLTQALAGIAGIALPFVPPGVGHAWWKYAFMVDKDAIRGGAVELGKRMKARGVFCVPRYIQKPAFECALFKDWSASPVTALPTGPQARGKLDAPAFRREDFPGTVRALDRVIVLPINEFYSAEHVQFVAQVIREEAAALRTGAMSSSRKEACP
jgi:UDP-N-acetylglucosamine 2-epimerase